MFRGPFQSRVAPDDTTDAGCFIHIAYMVRRKIYEQLYEQLNQTNLLNIILDDMAVPMVYPYLTKDNTLRQKLITERIYIPMYWSNIGDNIGLESQLKSHLLSIPLKSQIISIINTKNNLL